MDTLTSLHLLVLCSKGSTLFLKAMIYGEMIHSVHPDHMIKLVYEERPYICDGCHEHGFYSRYTCDDPFSSCNFHLHKCCALPEDTITHPFFPGSVFLFLQLGEPDRHCDACGRDILGFVYHCFENGLDLHPYCATLPNTVMIEGNEKLELHRKTYSQCDKCNKKDFKKGRKTWSYVSTDKECHLHIACVKDKMCEVWESTYLRGNDRERISDEDYAKALTKREAEPSLHIVLDKGKKKKSGGWLKKSKVIVKVALSVVIAVLVGDPSGLVVGLISSLLH